MIILATCGGGDGGNAAPEPQPATLALCAGSQGGPGSSDGLGAEVRFSNMFGVATDSAGNVYVADTLNHTIRKITPAGAVSTLAGSAGVAGSADGVGAEARFDSPYGVAADSAGNFYVAEYSNYTIRKITPAGIVSTLAGSAGVKGSADGVGADARFFNPRGIATDSAGNVYVADSSNYTIRKITPAGAVSTLAGSAGVSGSADGVGADARFSGPNGIATDSAGNVYVADTLNHTIRKITPAGAVSTLAGSAGVAGSADGVGADARFNTPQGVATDSAGNVYVGDSRNNTIRKIAPAGAVSTLAGSAGVWGSVDGVGADARFGDPRGIATDSAGNVFVADSGNNMIRKTTPAGAVTTMAGNARVWGSADGVGADARFFYPKGIATDSAGNVYVADTLNHTIRKITPAGAVSTLAGSAGASGSADGVGADARFKWPQGVATDSAGNLYVADTDNNTIRKITPAGAVSTLAGSAGVAGSVDGIGAEARFDRPSGVAADSDGNLYVADTWNNRIRKITAAGIVSTLAGSGSIGSADGTAEAASFGLCKIVYYTSVFTARICSAGALAIDSAGNAYLADHYNQTIRKITPSGVVITLAGSAGVAGSADGVGAAARFSSLYGVATDSAGNVYVAELGSHTIRKITPTAVVTTLVGVAGVQGFRSGVLPGLLDSPNGIAVRGDTLYVTIPHGVAEVRHLE